MKPAQEDATAGHSTAGHWSKLARKWDLVGPPLRPCAEDVKCFSQIIDGWVLKQQRAPRALILGVTPELCNLPWPGGSHVLAADVAEEMIRHVFPGSAGGVIRADWRKLPLACGSRDIVLCDGGLQMMAFPLETGKIAAEMSRIIATGGLCVIRLFSPPDVRENPQAVLDDLLGGRIPSVNHLKIRLAMSLQESPEEGVRLRRVWDALNAVAPDLHSLAQRLGWPEENLLAINTYRDRQARYHFVNERQIETAFCGNGHAFEMQAVHRASYAMGERCLTVTLRRIEPAAI